MPHEQNIIDLVCSPAVSILRTENIYEFYGGGGGECVMPIYLTFVNWSTLIVLIITDCKMMFLHAEVTFSFFCFSKPQVLGQLFL